MEFTFGFMKRVKRIPTNTSTTFPTSVFQCDFEKQLKISDNVPNNQIHTISTPSLRDSKPKGNQ